TAIVSHFNEFEDFFISSRLCRAFLMSAPTSTFGWWLAFFTRNQDAVYYLNDSRPLMRKTFVGTISVVTTATDKTRLWISIENTSLDIVCFRSRVEFFHNENHSLGAEIEFPCAIHIIFESIIQENENYSDFPQNNGESPAEKEF
ncbi:hypothetical protein OESDEN_20902, partial [Oesophagostomum dentatum]